MGSEFVQPQGKPACLSVQLTMRWVALKNASRRMKAIARRVSAAPSVASRLGILSTLAGNDASRIAARLAARGWRGPMPVETEDVRLREDVGLALRVEASAARALAEACERTKALAIAELDAATAWAAEAAREAARDRARELRALAETLEQEVRHG